MTEGQGSIFEHFRRAFEQAEQAVRCYLALALAQLEARHRQAARKAAWGLGLAVLGFIAIILIFSGLVRLADALFFSTPGLGRMCLGGALLLILVVCVVRNRNRSK